MAKVNKNTITLYFENKGKPLNVYPSNKLRQMIEADADDQLASLSKTILVILKRHYENFPPRKRSDLK